MKKRWFWAMMVLEGMVLIGVVGMNTLNYAAAPSGATTSLTVPIDEEPAASVSIRLLPGEKKNLAFSLTVNDAVINTSATYASYYLCFKNKSGVTLTTMGLTKSTSVTLTTTTLASTITSATYQAGIVCTSGTYRTVAGYFRITVPVVQGP